MKDVSNFLVSNGFKHLQAGNGCHEFVYDIAGGYYQINGIELCRIESDKDALIFTEERVVGGGEPITFYQKRYNNIYELIKAERSKINFKIYE